MYTLKELQAEIEQVIESMQNAPRPHPDWITQSVIANHPAIDGDDCDFYQCCTRNSVRDAVRKRLNKYKADGKEPDKQIVLEGFERLQKWYLMDEGGEQVAVSIQHMTRDQVLAKAEEQERMGAGCYQHAEELRRYATQMAA